MSINLRNPSHHFSHHSSPMSDRIHPFYKYTLRAECYYDLLILLRRLINISIKEDLAFQVRSFSVKADDVLPDCTLELETSYTLHRLRKIIAGILDGHVMLETIELTENYTGERNFDISDQEPYCTLANNAKSEPGESLPGNY